MSSQSLAMDQLNLVCPSCGNQFSKGVLRSIALSDYEIFVKNFSCPSCGVSCHPEDALLDFFRRVPTSELPGWPSQIGGSVSVGTIELDVGEVEEISLLGGGGLEIDLTLLAETSQAPGQSMQHLQGAQFEWYPGPIVVDNGSVVVDCRKTSQNELDFITSERQPAGSTVTVAYHYHTRLAGIPQPPWVTLLGNAIQSYHHGQGLSMLSLLFSALENLLSRELARTLYATGWTDNPIDDFLGRDKYWTWEQRIKGGLKTATGEHFPTEKPQIYHDLCKLRKTRNHEIIHVDRGGSVADIDINDFNNVFSSVLEAIIGINEIAYEARQRYQ